MTPTDDYLTPYRESVAKHGGEDFEATLWANRSSQQKRFVVFTQMAFLGGKRILDAGCGRGDFAVYLIDHDVRFGRYIGVDGLPEVIAFAATRKLTRCDFHAGDFVADPAVLRIGDPQVICISGALNTMELPVAMRVLEAAWAATGETLMFNFLSDRAHMQAPAQTGPARRHDTMKLLDWAMTRSSQVAFRQDYFKHGHDATIMMRKLA